MRPCFIWIMNANVKQIPHDKDKKGYVMQKIRPFFLCAALLTGISTAQAASFELNYDVRILGLRIGKATIDGKTNGGTYSIKGNGKITGLANMVVSGVGEASAQGGLTQAGLSPTLYKIYNTAGDKTNAIDMTMRGSSVVSLKVEPPTPEAPDRTPLLDEHKRGIIDPLSAFIMQRTTSATLSPEECNRTLEIFDGRQRYDIRLYPRSTQMLKGNAKGFSGEVLVCEAQYTPIAGHRPAKKVTRYLTENRENEVWLAPTADMKTLIPIKLQLKTLIGPLVIEANEYKSGV